MTQLKVPLYKVAETLLPGLTKRLERLDEKAQKMGGYVRLGWFDTEEYELDDGSSITLQLVTIQGIIGDADGDWTPAAKVEVGDGGNVVHRLPTFTEAIPDRFWKTGTECEHCNVSRRRKKIWVFYNTDTEDFVQVGSACLKDFTGDKNVSDVIKLSQIMLDVEKVVREAADTGIKVGNIPSTSFHYDLELFLCRVAAQIEEDGRYIGRGDDPAQSTANKALYRKGDVSEHLPLVKEALAWMFDAWKNRTSPNPYYQNMLTICSKSKMAYGNAGYVASLMAVYFSHLKNQNQGASTSQHFGVVGQTYKNVPLKAVHSRCFGENQWGLQYINRFEDCKKNVFVWFTKKGVEVDSNYALTLTVKKHDEFNGTPQTIITNCRITLQASVV